MAASLGEFYVEFSSRGKDKIDTDVDGITKGLEKADAEAGKATAGIGAKLATVGEAMNRVATGAGNVGSAIGQKLAGGVLAGLAPVGNVVVGVGKLAGGAVALLTSPFRAAVSAATGFASTLLGPVAGAVGKLAGGVVQIGQATQTAFGGALNVIQGFARAGLQGTTMGERLGLQFQLVSREIASLFIPVLERVIGALQRVTDWFRTLSGPQQAFIGYVVSAGIALVALGTILPQIVGGLSGIRVLLAALSANPIVLIVGAIAALLAGTEQGRSALGRLADAFMPIISAVGQLFEALSPLLELLGNVLGFLANAAAGVVNFLAGALESATDFLGLTSEADREEARRGRERQQRPTGANRNELANVSRGPESLQASFLRFQQGAMRTSQGIPEQQLAEQRRTNQLLQQQIGIEAQPAPAPVS